MSPPNAIVFRDIEQLSEMREVESLQKTIWGVEDLDILPALAMRPLIEVGGILIGAFDRDRMVGFVFGFPGHHNGQNIIHSDMLGVLPEYRSFSLGYRLKLAQRNRAIAMGIETITWTFDPLRVRNARLNFARLGVTANRYEIDYYGETSSALHRLGTDRLWVTWSLNSEHTRSRVDMVGNEGSAVPFSAEAVSLTKVSESQHPIVNEDFSAAQALIEIPTTLDEMLKSQLQIASEWRAATRKAFTGALAAGYTVEDFVMDRQQQKGAYILTA